MKILIEIKDGNLVSILTSEDAEIVIIDHDNHEEGKSLVDGIHSPDATAERIYTLFTGKDSVEIQQELKKLNF